jgi:D-serine/D-alanine/glycine transporter
MPAHNDNNFHSESTPANKLKRNLSNRHIQLIAISGAIGTGLFMGSGKTISLAGPSIVFVYMIIGFVLFFVMRAMGELLLSNLHYRSFTDFASDLLGPWAGYFTGWTYWFCWIVTGTADVIAIAGYAQFWWPDLAGWIPAILTILLLLCLNLLSVKLFGETEFWFSMIKIITICALILVGIFLVATAFTSPSGTQASVSNIWAHGGMFPKGVMGFFAGFQIAVFAFVGIELVGTTAAETKDPETTLPRAINSIPFRIIFFYIFALLAIMAVTPWSSIIADKSPFVEMFTLIGLPAAAGAINFVVMTSAASSANSGVYSTSRMLYSLATSGVAPKAFSRLSAHAVPAAGLLFSCICLLCGATLIFIMPNIMAAFTVVTTVSATLFMFVWSIILISYLVFRRQRPEKHAASLFKMPGGILMTWVSLAFFAFVIVLLMLEADTRQALLVTPIWFIVLGVGYYRIKRKITHTIQHRP